MAIQVIHGGDVNSFDMLAFPMQNAANASYIQNQLTNFSQSLTDIGRKFIETSQQIYDRVNDSSVLRAARAAIRVAGGMFHPNEIVQLNTLDELRFAQPIMQRYIMAEPSLRDMYARQQCDGFSDSYANIDPGSKGENHYDYRRVMHGIIVDKVDEGGNDTWSATQYYQENRGDDTELPFEEQVAILRTWDIVKLFVDAGVDPSDPFAPK